jgi:hypothetical protein
VDGSSATVNGTVNPDGASAKVSFQFGTTTAYGQTTAPQLIGPATAATAFAALLSGLPAGTTIHYRAIASTNFGTFTGADRTLTTAGSAAVPPPPGTGTGAGSSSIGHVAVVRRSSSGRAAEVRVSCRGAAGAVCRLTARLSVVETFRGHRLVAASASGRNGGSHRAVVLGTSRITLVAGQTRSVRIALNGTGRRLVARLHRLEARLQIRQSDLSGRTRTVFSRTVAFKAPSPGSHRTR